MTMRATILTEELFLYYSQIAFQLDVPWSKDLPAHVRPGYDLVSGASASHSDGIGDIGVRPKRFYHRMASANNLDGILVIKLRLHIIVLHCNQCETEQAIRGCEFVDGAPHDIIMLIRDFLKEGNICSLGFYLERKRNQLGSLSSTNTGL